MALKKVDYLSNLNCRRLYPEHEKYVIVNSQAFKEIYENKLKTATNPDKLEGLVKISGKSKPIFRKCIGGHVKSIDNIEMGYRSAAELKVTPSQEVDIKPACWFEYMWRNSESQIRFSFMFAVIGVVLTIIFGIVSIVLTICRNCCCL